MSRETVEKLPTLYPDRCEFVDRTPIYAKKIGGIRIDPSEYTHPDGAHVMNLERHCKLVRDKGEKYCPRHKALTQAKTGISRTSLERE